MNTPRVRSVGAGMTRKQGAVMSEWSCAWARGEARERNDRLLAESRPRTPEAPAWSAWDIGRGRWCAGSDLEHALERAGERGQLYRARAHATDGDASEILEQWIRAASPEAAADELLAILACLGVEQGGPLSIFVQVSLDERFEVLANGRAA